MLLVKIGGGKSINLPGICEDIAYLSSREKIVVVHGASAYRDEIAQKLSIPLREVVSPSGFVSVFTDDRLLDVFLMTYAGLVNKRIVSLLQRNGVNAIGLSGVDGKLWIAKPKKDIIIKEKGKTILLKNNLTGKVESVNIELIELLLKKSYLPVICSPAISPEGEILNVDNDLALAVMAEGLKIKKIVFLFEKPGLLENHDDEKTVIPRIEKGKIEEYLKFAMGRMKKKLIGVKRALDGGVDVIYFGDGRVDNPLINTLKGNGTVIS
ncbi:MAG: [LysW]-aminoadipate kinase [Candidatus Aminicenantia bacterium]